MAHDILAKIGQGSFSSIYLVEYKGKKYAKKIYNERAENLLKSIESSLTLAKKISHENIIRVHSVSVSTEPAYCILEYVDGLQIHKVSNIKNKLKIFLPQIISALSYLHKNKIIHRDIKPENILVGQTRSLLRPIEIVKLVDLDFIRNFSDDGIKRVAKTGTPYFMAPEMLKGESYDCRIDIWALGISLYYILTTSYPYHGESRDELEALILSDSIPDYSILPSHYRQMIKEMLVKNPEERISLRNVLMLIK